ncbi:patatin-like phospholipase family protein [Terrihalobacillus insolitus]|uniref:patatin-like phospholipase family protein n=1 Tax=Terrihalobacillus insolitus TaxID=2950438 RepID=UPI002340BC95|nr:patatin-like phospholipase family protein [Terrihalobacillus insolitus]MDC3412814.1 patatin-like phospholipase family protein [Terrihalobacillus insolitus]
MSNPTIGLALGSGGARGFSHLGVLKVLTENKIPVHLIAGSSMGALVGALYASGQEMKDLYRMALAFKRKYFLDFTVPKMGFIQGDRIKDYIRLFTYQKKIEECKIPIGIVTTNLYTGHKKVFYEGDIAQAIRASISIPGIFVPEEINGELYVDGGVIDRVPVSIAREMGADIVIAVDCAHFTPTTEIHSIYDVMLQSIDIMQDELVKHGEMDTNIMLKPDVTEYSTRAFTNTKQIIEKGEEEATTKLGDIITCIEAWKENKNDSNSK